MAQGNGDAIREALYELRAGIVHPVLNWQMVAALVTILIAGAIGAIQLGTAQTHILINTVALDHIVAKQDEHSGNITGLLASEHEQDRRLAAIETHDVDTRQTEAAIVARISKIEALNEEQNRRLAAIEQLIKDAAAKGDITQASNTLRVEFQAEIKRIDQLLNSTKK